MDGCWHYLRRTFGRMALAQAPPLATSRYELGAAEVAARPPNKRMQLTKLRAAPVLKAEVPPCAPAAGTDGGTASQLIRSVRRLVQREGEGAVGSEW